MQEYILVIPAAEYSQFLDTIQTISDHRPKMLYTAETGAGMFCVVSVELDALGLTALRLKVSYRINEDK